MKKAANQWCFPADWSWMSVFEACEDVGFAGLELCLDYPSLTEAIRGTPSEPLIMQIARSVGWAHGGKSLRIDSPDRDVEHVAEIAAAHGVAIASVLSIAQFHFSLVEADAHLREIGIDIVRRMIRVAELVGAPSVLVVPGLVTSTVEYDAARDRLIDALRVLAPLAEASRVVLAIEDVWGKILYSPLEMRDLVDEVGSRWIGVHLDVGNVMQYGYPDQWIRILGHHRVRAVHLKDFVERIGNLDGFTHLFQGDVPWERVMNALRSISYSGYLIAEVPPYRFAPAEGIRDIARKIDILLGADTE